MLEQKYFSQDDVIRLRKLMHVIVKQAQFTRTLDDFVGLFNDIDWVNKSILPKMEAFIVDEVKIKQKTKDIEQPSKQEEPNG